MNYNNYHIVNPNVTNLVNSLRDIGYTFEVAVADIVDNSVTAEAKNISIYLDNMSPRIFELLDDGYGMSDEELVEAMRIAAKNPLDEREKKDLGRFGLGLKTASFSQCKKLTVFSKKNKKISGYCWDLDYISKIESWHLIKIDIEKIQNYNLIENLNKLDSGTLIIWENMDRADKNEVSEIIDKLIKHLSLVFHRFLEKKNNRLKIEINGKEIIPFNPFNPSNMATQEHETELLYIDSDIPIKVKPFILPHHSKLTREDYEYYATDDGYTKSQGFYLYRADRLLIHGTWFGLHKLQESHRLVRIAIDIPNNRDSDWGIDIKKSLAKPAEIIKKDLKRIIKNITPKGSKPYTGRGKKIEDKSTDRYWSLLPQENSKVAFKLNKDNKILKKLNEILDEEQTKLFKIYLDNIENYIPLDAIVSNLQENPYKVEQKKELTEEQKIEIRKSLLESGLDEEYINKLENLK